MCPWPCPIKWNFSQTLNCLGHWAAPLLWMWVFTTQVKDNAPNAHENHLTVAVWIASCKLKHLSSSDSPPLTLNSYISATASQLIHLFTHLFPVAGQHERQREATVTQIFSPVISKSSHGNNVRGSKVGAPEERLNRDRQEAQSN